MAKKSKVFKNSFLYTFSTLLIRAMSFLLMPVYTLFLTPEDYGVINLISSFIGVATFIVAFSLYSAIGRFYVEYRNDHKKLKRFYGTIITFTIISSTIFSVFFILFKNIIIKFIFDGIEFFPMIFLALLILTFSSLYTIHQNILKGMQRGKKITILNLIVFITQASLNIIFIVYYKLGSIGMLLATFIINLGYCIYMIFDLKRYNLMEFCIDRELLKESLQYSIPLIPHNLSTNIASFISRLFIKSNGSLSSVGLYSVASQFSGLIDVVQVSVNQAFLPWFYEKMSNRSNKNDKEIVNLSYILVLFYSFIYLLIGLFSQEVLLVMTNENYITAWTTIPILVSGFSVKSIYYFYVNILFYHKNLSKKIFIASIIGSLADIILSYVLVPLYGMYGASLSFLFAKIIIVLIVVVISKKYDDIGYRLKYMIRIICTSLLFMMVGLYFSYTKYIDVLSLSNIVYKLTILIIYIVFAYISNKKLIKETIREDIFKYFKKK